MKFYKFFLLLIILLFFGFFNPEDIRKTKDSFGFITKQAMITLKCKNCSTVPFSVLTKIESLNMFFYFNAITKASSWIIHKKNKTLKENNRKILVIRLIVIIILIRQIIRGNHNNTGYGNIDSQHVGCS